MGRASRPGDVEFTPEIAQSLIDCHLNELEGGLTMLLRGAHAHDQNSGCRRERFAKSALEAVRLIRKMEKFLREFGRPKPEPRPVRGPGRPREKRIPELAAVVRRLKKAGTPWAEMSDAVHAETGVRKSPTTLRGYLYRD